MPFLSRIVAASYFSSSTFLRRPPAIAICRSSRITANPYVTPTAAVVLHFSLISFVLKTTPLLRIWLRKD